METISSHICKNTFVIECAETCNIVGCHGNIRKILQNLKNYIFSSRITVIFQVTKNFRRCYDLIRCDRWSNYKTDGILGLVITNYHAKTNNSEVMSAVDQLTIRIMPEAVSFADSCLSLTNTYFWNLFCIQFFFNGELYYVVKKFYIIGRYCCEDCVISTFQSNLITKNLK